MPSALQSSRRMILCFDFVPPWQESPLCVMSYWAGDYRRVQFHQYEICPLVGIHQLLWAFTSLCQSITILGFTMELSTDIVLCTRLCLFFKQLIQLLEAKKLLILRRAATCRAFTFRWDMGSINGCVGSMDLLEPSWKKCFKFFQWQSLRSFGFFRK